MVGNEDGFQIKKKKNILGISVQMQNKLSGVAKNFSLVTIATSSANPCAHDHIPQNW
jgi:hypothetical protein